MVEAAAGGEGLGDDLAGEQFLQVFSLGHVLHDGVFHLLEGHGEERSSIDHADPQRDHQSAAGKDAPISGGCA